MFSLVMVDFLVKLYVKQLAFSFFFSFQWITFFMCLVNYLVLLDFAQRMLLALVVMKRAMSIFNVYQAFEIIKMKHEHSWFSVFRFTFKDTFY